MNGFPYTFLTVLLIFAKGAQAQSLTMRAEPAGSGLRIVLQWSGLVEFTSSSTDQELTVRFNRPVGLPAVEEIQRAFPEWLDGISYGYDSMLFRSVEPMDFSVTGDGISTTIELVRKGVPPFSEEAERQAQLRLDVLRAQLLINQRRDSEAERLLMTLSETYPAEPQILLNLADLALRKGRWRSAKQYYERVLMVDPRNEDVEPGLRNPLILNQASAIFARVERRIVRGGQREDIVQLGTHHLFGNYLRLGVNLAESRTRADNAQQPDGERKLFDGKVRRGEIYVQYDFERGSLLRGGLLADEVRSERGRPQLGSTVAYEVTDSQGRWHLQADYRRPFWDFVEGIVGRGTRDRVEARREQQFGRYVSGRMTAAQTRYGLERYANAARSFTTDGALTGVFGGFGRVVGFEYAFDAEYRQNVRTEIRASDGQTFQPIPLINREVHALSVFTDIQLRRLQANAFAGYALDRLGGRGPFFGANLTLRPVRVIELTGIFDRRLNTIATTQFATRYGAQFTWRFD